MKEIRFNRKIYLLRAVQRSIRDFKDIANMSLKKDDKYVTVTIEDVPEDQDIETISDEFKNYVLGMTIAMKRKL